MKNPARTAHLSPGALAEIVRDATGPTTVCIRDLAMRTFDPERVRRFLRDNNGDDPELAEFFEEVHELVHAEWLKLGVTDEVGPYLK
jgi:hypothetical protein